MTSVYVDTNILLDFYRRSELSLASFQDLKKLGERVVFTQQTVNEFERNRASALTTAIADLTDFSVAAIVLPTGLMAALDEFKELESARKTVEQRVKKMQVTLQKYVDDDTTDPVLAEFYALIKSARVLNTTDDNVQRAHYRYLLGNPPMSKTKGTICDELIWETLLRGCKDDLYLCSRDKTFTANEPFLRAEYQRTTKKKLTVTSELAAAIKAAGGDATQVKKAEQDLAQREQANAKRVNDAYHDLLRTWQPTRGSERSQPSWVNFVDENDPSPRDLLTLKLLQGAFRDQMVSSARDRAALAAAVEGAMAVRGSPGAKAAVDVAKALNPAFNALVDAAKAASEKPGVKALADAAVAATKNPGVKALANAAKVASEKPVDSAKAPKKPTGSKSVSPSGRGKFAGRKK